MLVRALKASDLGLFAIASFVSGASGTLLDFGIHNLIIKRTDRPSSGFLATVAYIRLRLIFFAGLVIFLLAAPFLARWYKQPTLAWLTITCFLGVAFGAMFKPAQSMLEREFEYGKIGLLELFTDLCFYIPSVTLAMNGFGIIALGIGECCRGLASAGGLWFVNVVVFPRYIGRFYKEIRSFGLGLLGTTLTWMPTGAVNPLVVGKMAGLEACGVIRVAEGIVNQLSLFRRIGERLAYPVFAKLKSDPIRVLRAVEEGRMLQFIVGVLPLFVFTSASKWAVPALYGVRWSAVSNVLPIYCMSTSISLIFGIYSSALITAGRTKEVILFHLVYVGSFLILSIPLVGQFGYCGLPLAAIAASPAYSVISRTFTKLFGSPNNSPLMILMATSWVTLVVVFLFATPVVAVTCLSMMSLGLIISYSPAREPVWRMTRTLMGRSADVHGAP